MAASLGTGTGSRVDSAAKHIMACKMDSRLLSSYVKDECDTNNYLHINKHKFCMTKDEIVMNTTRKGPEAPNAAYPLVITTLGEMDDSCKDFLLTLYSKRSASEFYRQWRQRKKVAQSILVEDSNVKRKVKVQLDTLPNMRVQGVALGTAYASPLTGDTVASVLVGGVVTVMNGAFPMHTGDQVQWYFDFEEVNFRLNDLIDNISRAEYAIGSRKTTTQDITTKRDSQSDLQKRKRDYFDAHVSGQSTNSIGNISGLKSTPNKFRIKSYHLYQQNEPTGDETMCLDHYGDKSRIFAVCLGGGRPYDMVDIMLMTQSL